MLFTVSVFGDSAAARAANCDDTGPIASRVIVERDHSPIQESDRLESPEGVVCVCRRICGHSEIPLFTLVLVYFSDLKKLSCIKALSSSGIKRVAAISASEPYTCEYQGRLAKGPPKANPQTANDKKLATT